MNLFKTGKYTFVKCLDPPITHFELMSHLMKDVTENVWKSLFFYNHFFNNRIMAAVVFLLVGAGQTNTQPANMHSY
jgi:hypothetical protein